MKTFLKISLVLITMLAVSCKPEPKPSPVILSGTIANGADMPVMLVVNDIAIDSATTDSAGGFSFNTTLDKECYATLDVNGEFVSLFLSPKNQIVLNSDFTNMSESLEFTGKQASIQHHLNNKVAQQTEAGLLSREVYYMLPELALLHLDSVQSSLLFQLELALRDAKKVSPYFIANEEADIKYSVGIMKQQFPAYYKYFNKLDSVNLPDRFDRYREDLTFNDDMLADCRSFINYVKNAMEDSMTVAYNADSTFFDNTSMAAFNMDWIATNITAPKVKASLSYDIIKDQLNYYGLDDVAPYLDEFKANCGDSIKLANINELEGKWLAIVAGSNAPNFRYYNHAGDSTSLSTFRGKYVYIDAWATWCGPCKREIPSLKALEEEFAGENIVFMSVSLDNEDKMQDWMDFVDENELGGVQLYGGDGFKSSLAKDYHIRSIPRFILIDPNGKIADPNMSRPSEKETAETLANLLQKSV